MQMRRATVICLAIASVSCMKNKTDEREAAIAIDSEASARAAIGKRVRISGTADNAKLGAVVVVNDLVVYCSHRTDGWDERGRAVVVEGVLERSEGEAVRAPDGTMSAGIEGPVFRMTCEAK